VADDELRDGSTGLEITFATFPIMVIGNHDFLPIKQKYGRSGGFA
jgi:hypothetical protein